MSTDRQKKLLSTIDTLEKEFGKGSVIDLSSKPKQNIPVISTGSLGLDLALGVGGFPKGRIIEIYGPESSGKTTIALQAIAESQKKGGVSIFIDAEHAFDDLYATNLGIDLSGDKFRIVQPDNGEQALEMTEKFIRSEVIDIIVIDSVAALTPKSEIEGEMGDSKMGLHARMMSQAMRKLVAVVSKTNTTVIFINQLRSKIGVVYGCFHYSAKVLLEDGSYEKIGKIVNNKINKRVMSYNFKTGNLEAKKILNYYDNGNSDFFYCFEAERYSKSGISKFSCTRNHTIFTPNGEKSAESINVNDYILGTANFGISDLQLEIISGSMLGDGSLKRIGKRSIFRIGHGIKQNDYCKWKYDLLKNISNNFYENSAGGVSFDTKSFFELKRYNELYSNEGRVLTEEFLNNLTPLSIAIWYMDDASLSGSYNKWGFGKVEISIKSYSRLYSEMLIETLNTNFGITPTYTKKKTLLFSGEQSQKIQELVCKYIHPSMNYKLIPEYRNMFLGIDKNDLYKESYKDFVPVKVLKKYIKPKTRSMKKFDLQIEGNSNYIVSDVLVHNSPEVTTGGNALKFYASVRLDIRKQIAIKDKEGILLGNRTKVKVIKNKVAPPFRTAEFDIMYGQGVSKAGEIIDWSVEMDIIKKSGSWFSYNEQKLGQGRDQVKSLLLDNPELMEELETKIYENIYPND